MIISWTSLVECLWFVNEQAITSQLPVSKVLTSFSLFCHLDIGDHAKTNTSFIYLFLGHLGTGKAENYQIAT